MRTYTINGNKFKSPKGFYRYAESIFTLGITTKLGRSFDAFIDILHGGFGQHEAGETIKVIWINRNKSRENLSKAFYEDLTRVFEELEFVIFEPHEFRP